MYQPYDPFGFQPYNDPQPEHYAAGVPQGMPQPARPSGLFGSTDPPGYPSFQDQYYQGANNNTYDAQFGSQPYGSQAQPQAQPNYYPGNAAPPVPHTGSHHYPPHSGQSGASLSHTASHHYPPSADSSFYPATSSAPPYSTLQPPAETSWAPPSYPPQDERPVHSTHSVAKRDEKESVRFSVDEAQRIIKDLKETNKNLTLQLTNSRDSSTKAVQEKEARIEQLQKDLDAARRQQGEAVKAKAVEAKAVEAEWQQRMSAKERETQEVLSRAQKEAEAKERDWAERLSKAEQESAEILARFNKLQLDADSGRAFLLESKSAQEAELRKLKEEARKYDAEVVRLRDESNKQEAELMKLRDETNKLLDEITQMVDDKENALATIKHLEEEKHQLEDRLNGSSDDIVAAKNAAAAERAKLSRTIDDLKDELEHAHDLCEERRLRIESMEEEQLPTLNSQIDLMTNLYEKQKEKLEETQHERDRLEKQLVNAEQREMESSLRMAGERDELQRLRSELESHKVGKSDTEKLASELESEKMMLEQKVAQVEDEKREALGRISKLEMSLNEAMQAKTGLEEDLEIIRETMEREAEDNETAQAEYRSKLEELEEEVKSLASAKSALETQVVQSEAKITETERLLHATEAMLKVLNEELEQNRELETKAKGMESLGEEKTALEAKLTALEVENAQMAEEISELTKRVELLEKEKLRLENEYDSFDALVGKLERDIEEKDAELASVGVEVMAKRRLEREIKGLKLELSKEKAEMERLKVEMDLMNKIGHDQSVKIVDLEEAREDLEARIAALLEDKKRASVQASQLGEQMLLLESENKEVKQSFTEISTKYLEIVAERDGLQQDNRNLRNK